MALFENRYKAAARTELDRQVREIKERDITAETVRDYRKDAEDVKNNIGFAERVKLINAQEADRYRTTLRLYGIRAQQYERFQRNEAQERVDDIENPRERTERYCNMESVQAQIRRAREDDSIKSKQDTTAPAKDDHPDPERTK